MGTAIYTIYSKNEQLSTPTTVGTVIYTVYSRNSSLHCLQWEQLSTLSTVGTAIYTVYNGNCYCRTLVCLPHPQT